MPSAPASTCPLAAQIDGLAQLADQPEQAREASRAEVAVDDRDVGREAAQVGARGEDGLVRRGRARRSARCGSSRAASNASISSPSSSLESALRVSGWFSVIVATPVARRRRAKSRTAKVPFVGSCAESRKFYCLLLRSRLVALPRAAVKPAHPALTEVFMATAAPEIKPDYSSRSATSASPTSTRRCASRSRASQRRSWRPTPPSGRRHGFPDSVFTAHGRARVPRDLLPGGVRRPGRRLPDVDRARRGDGVRRTTAAW